MRVQRNFLMLSLAALGFLALGCSSTKTSTPSTVSNASTSPQSSSPSTASNWKVAQGGNQALMGWLDGVDCVTATSCVAVGNESSPAGPSNALVETLNQGSWSAVTAPGAPSGQGDFLFSVSCPSAGACVAVGYYFSMINGSGAGTALIETLANGKWSVASTPSLGSGVKDSFLNGVSCATPTSCVAVGNTDGGDSSTELPLILTLVGGVWSSMPTPSLGSHGGLLSVACTSPTACIATGYQAASGSNRTLVESLSSGSWMVTSSPGSGGPTPTYGPRGLNGISCVAAASCVAVGQLTGPGPIVETMSNGRWSTATNPIPRSKDGATGLYGVSCTTTTTCVAVGVVAKGFGSNAPDGAFGLPLGPLIESTSGGPWTITANPSGLPDNSGLHAISCVGQTCVAVGQTGQFATQMSTVNTLIIQTK
jgi:hypothetical protein